MWIEQLVFRNFRNLAQIALAPQPGINVFWGDNGQGKTNLLEGIYLFPHLKSFRGAGNVELIGPVADGARVTLQIRQRGLERHAALTVNPHSRSFLLDGKTPRPIERLLDAVRAVLFAPDELHQLRTVPAARRALLDRAVFQLDPGYLTRVLEYERILRQRNRLLREESPRELLRPWSEALVRTGAELRRARIQFLAGLAGFFDAAQRYYTGEQERAELLYLPANLGLEAQESLLAEELEQVAGRERRLGQSCAGPHRDDPLFLLNGQPVRHFASQGQWRTLVLSFKTALLRLVQEQIGEPPVLLLDDMAAELDRERQARLFALLAECGAQVFVTTTDPTAMRRLGLPQVAYFQVQSGRVLAGNTEE